MTDSDSHFAQAGIVRRLTAMVYDSLLVLAVLLLGTFPWVLPRGRMPDDSLNPEPLGPLYQVYCVLLIIGFFLLAWHRKQATLGMRAWRMKLVDHDGGKPTSKQMLVRLIAAPVAWLPLAAGIFWQYRDPDGLTWHDRWSGTRIVLIKKPAKD
ncbi:MAG: RDD family protein [Pseudomonadota bacterium]